MKKKILLFTMLLSSTMAATSPVNAAPTHVGMGHNQLIHLRPIGDAAGQCGRPLTSMVRMLTNGTTTDTVYIVPTDKTR